MDTIQSLLFRGQLLDDRKHTALIAKYDTEQAHPGRQAE